jgi:hypothetical protein
LIVMVLFAQEFSVEFAIIRRGSANVVKRPTAYENQSNANLDK